MPVRKIPKSYRNVTGVSASTKSVGDAQFESTLERDFLALLEFSPEVEKLEVQPIKLEWLDEQGKRRSYTPDVLVEFKPELQRLPWLCEVKYRNDIKKHWQELHPKFLRAIRYAKQHRWRFRLITEQEIRTPYLANVRFLKPFKFRSVPEADSTLVSDQLGTLGHTTPKDLMQSLSPDAMRQAELLPALWQLIAGHRIGTDLEPPLTMDSIIWSNP
jgi:hypothetical protein